MAQTLEERVRRRPRQPEKPKAFEPISLSAVPPGTESTPEIDRQIDVLAGTTGTAAEEVRAALGYAAKQPQISTGASLEERVRRRPSAPTGGQAVSRAAPAARTAWQILTEPLAPGLPPEAEIPGQFEEVPAAAQIYEFRRQMPRQLYESFLRPMTSPLNLGLMALMRGAVAARPLIGPIARPVARAAAGFFGAEQAGETYKAVLPYLKKILRKPGEKAKAGEPSFLETVSKAAAPAAFSILGLLGLAKAGGPVATPMETAGRYERTLRKSPFLDAESARNIQRHVAEVMPEGEPREHLIALAEKRIRELGGERGPLVAPVPGAADRVEIPAGAPRITVRQQMEKAKQAPLPREIAMAIEPKIESAVAPLEPPPGLAERAAERIRAIEDAAKERAIDLYPGRLPPEEPKLIEPGAEKPKYYGVQDIERLATQEPTLAPTATEPVPSMAAPTGPMTEAQRRAAGIRSAPVYDPARNIDNAIRFLGGINPDRIKKAGTEAEWKAIPNRLGLIRKGGTHGPDTIVAELRDLGYDIKNEADLLSYVNDPKRRKRSLLGEEVSEREGLEAEVEKLSKMVADLQAEKKAREMPEDWLADLLKGEEGAVLLGFPGSRQERAQLISDRINKILAETDPTSETYRKVERLDLQVTKILRKFPAGPAALLQRRFGGEEGFVRIPEEIRKPLGSLFGEEQARPAKLGERALKTPEELLGEIEAMERERRATTKGEIEQRIVQAPEGKTSKRVILGLEKRKKEPQVTGPAPQKPIVGKQRALFGPEEGFLRFRNDPDWADEPAVKRALTRLKEIERSSNKPPRMPTPDPGEASVPGGARTALGYIQSADIALERVEVSRPIVQAMKYEAERPKTAEHARLFGVLDDINKRHGIKPRSPEDEMVADLLNSAVTRLTPESLVKDKSYRGNKTEAIAAYREARDQIYDPLIARIRSPRLEAVIGKVGYIGGYFPWIHALEMRSFGKASGMSVLRDLLPAEFLPGVFKPRAQGISKAQTRYTEATRAYISSALRAIYDIPAYEKAIASAEQIPSGPWREFAKWYAQNYIGEPNAKSLAMRNGTYVAASRWMADRYYDSYIGVNLPTYALNLTQTITNTYPEIGRFAAVGLRQLMTESGRKTFHESGLVFDAPILEGMAPVGRLRAGLHKGMQQTEYVNRGIAYLGGLAKARHLGLVGEAAKNYAYKVVGDTQFLYTKGSPIWALEQAGPAGKQFMTFPLKENEFVTNMFADALRKRDKESLTKAGRFLMVTLGPLVGAKAAGLDLDRWILGLSDILPGIAPLPRDLLIELPRYVYGVSTGRRKIDDVPTDFLQAVLNRAPAANAIKKAYRMIQ